MRKPKKHRHSLLSRLLLAGVVAVFGLVSLAAPVLRCACGVGCLTGSICEPAVSEPVQQGCCLGERETREPEPSEGCACEHDVQAAPKAKLPGMQLAAAGAEAQILQQLAWALTVPQVLAPQAGFHPTTCQERGSPPPSVSIYLIHQNIRC